MEVSGAGLGFCKGGGGGARYCQRSTAELGKSKKIGPQNTGGAGTRALPRSASVFVPDCTE